MKVLVAIVMGLLSGLLVYFMVGILSADLTGKSEPAVVVWFTAFVAAWVISAVILVRGAQTVSQVFRRGFLLGAAEWFVMAAVGVIFSGKAMSSATAASTTTDPAAQAGAAIGGGIFAVLAGGFSVFMAVVCLIGFAIAYFIGREMRDTSGIPTRKCPECAEMVQAEARKCRYCGAQLRPETSPPLAGSSAS
jgi:hypothetical protein